MMPMTAQQPFFVNHHPREHHRAPPHLRTAHQMNLLHTGFPLPTATSLAQPTSAISSSSSPSSSSSSSSEHDNNLLAALTSTAKSTMGMYCKVIVGHAPFRTGMCNVVIDRIIVWASSHPDKVFLFGKRAWNAHLSDKTFEEATTDIDLMVDWSCFSSLTLNCLRLIHTDCSQATPYMNVFTKTHSDGRGKTMTIEVCGVSVADMASRDTPGDFCIGGNPRPQPATPSSHQPHSDPLAFAILRHVATSSGRQCTLAVLKRSTMMKMLDAESELEHHWRKDKAGRDLKKYMVFDALGFFHSDEECPATHSAQPATHSASMPHLVHVVVPADETSFQLPILAKYLRACSSVEECVRAARNLFFWIEGDAMSSYIRRVIEARTIADCRAIAREIGDGEEGKAEQVGRRRCDDHDDDDDGDGDNSCSL